MASIRKLKSGLWQAQIAKRGIRRSKTFKTKYEANDWAVFEEAGIARDTNKNSCKLTFSEVINEYLLKVTPTKKSAKIERLLLKKLLNHDLASKRITEIKSKDLAEWRDERLTQVSNSTARRDLAVITNIFTYCVDEWGYIEKNPLKSVKKPKENPARNRRVTDEEIEALVYVSGLDATPETAAARTIQAFIFAIKTGMRAGEIADLKWTDIDFDLGVAHLPKTKNGFSRDVSLFDPALQILSKMRPVTGHKVKCFDLTSAQIDAHFRKIRDRTAIQDLHFHDSRHEACSRLSADLDVLALAKMLGHRNLNMLINVYYNVSAADTTAKHKDKIKE